MPILGTPFSIGRNMIKTAILVDGSFFLRRYYYFWGAENARNPEKAANDLWAHCIKHIDKDREQIYRIYFYDCPPLEKKVHYPVSRKAVDLSKSETCLFRKEFHKRLIQKPYLALRLGYLDEKNANWIIKDSKINKKVISGTISAASLSDELFYYQANQKGVDMKIGLDIASLAYKKLANKIVLIAGDSDFVPAAKLARREGLHFILDPMHNMIREDLKEHIDGLKTTLPKRKIKP